MEETTMLRQIREKRAAKEKARFDKLRELNLKKYKVIGELPVLKNSKSNQSLTSKPALKPKTNENSKIPVKNSTCNGQMAKNVDKINDKGQLKRSFSASATVNRINTVNNNVVASKNLAMKNDDNRTKPSTKIVLADVINKIKNDIKSTVGENTKKTSPKKTVEIKKEFVVPKVPLPSKNPSPIKNKPTLPSKISKENVDSSVLTKNLRKSIAPSTNDKPVPTPRQRASTVPATNQKPVPMARKSLAPPSNQKPVASSRKSMLPITNNLERAPKDGRRETVFERLYKPKTKTKEQEDNITKLKTDSKYRENVIKQANSIVNLKRHTVFENKSSYQPVRRSISAVHFKRIAKNELPNCIHKWASITDLNKVDVKQKLEDEKVRQEKIVSAVKSDRKRVTFQKPFQYSMQFNTPRPDEMQSRLKNWLAKRGKSIDHYHHLQCFGLHHLAQSEKEFKNYDDEDKENISLEHDSDNDSYHENMNIKLDIDNKWRRASIMSTNDMDETKETIGSEAVGHDVEDLVIGALNDLTDLLREGFDWEQSSRWLRAIRERFPFSTEKAAYWECRAALEERQGNLPASVQCWEEAIAKGTESSVAESNLDHLLDKFMQLKISPRSQETSKEKNSKLLDVKNVFKSTIIRFAVQQAKLRQSAQHDEVKYLITPVRRSSRVSCSSARKTPKGRRTPLVQIVTSSIRQIDSQLDGKSLFVPNELLPNTP